MPLDADNVEVVTTKINEYLEHINMQYPGYNGNGAYTNNQYRYTIDGDSIITLNGLSIGCYGKFEILIDMQLSFIRILDKNNKLPFSLLECAFNDFDLESFSISST